MGLQVTGDEQLAFLLEQGGMRAKKGAFHQMMQEAEEMAKLARQMAPVDEGYLEKAIVAERVNAGRDRYGRYQRQSVIIGVDEEKAADGNSTVGDYAYVMHEHLTPYGRFQLGEKSQEKQRLNPRITVGGKYLERAVAERMENLMERVRQAVIKALI